MYMKITVLIFVIGHMDRLEFVITFYHYPVYTPFAFSQQHLS
jgi:hypothetical protein